MRDKTGEKVIGDCINAVFQGFFDKQILSDQQSLEGLGIVVDDEFNFMLSHWRGSMLNGDSFVRTSCGHLIYGAFEQNLPVGLVSIHKEGFKLFLNRISLKSKGIQWFKEVGVFDSKSNIFYVLELDRRDDQETTIDPKLSNSQTSRYDRIKSQWKIKISERCPLKSDGTPATVSKLIKRYEKKVDYYKGDFTTREQNQISLLASTLGNAFQKASFVSSRTYLKEISKDNPKISLNRFKEPHEEEQTLWLSLVDRSFAKKNEKKLGLTLSLAYDYIKSLGTYSQEGYLNGLGVQYRKNGESFVGIFKQNLLAKEYKFNQMGTKNVATFPIRQLTMQQHLKSLNYVHNSIYLPQLGSITAISNKIIRYIQAFERQYQKRNINYNDTPSYQSITSETMNIYKYVDSNREKYEEMASSRPQLISDNTDREVKKPGFIFHKSNNKSFEKSPINKQKTPSPAQKSKSPLRHVRITGKIYHETQRPSPGHSPSRLYTRLKLNQDTYKRGKNY